MAMSQLQAHLQGRVPVAAQDSSGGTRESATAMAADRDKHHQRQVVTGNMKFTFETNWLPTADSLNSRNHWSKTRRANDTEKDLFLCWCILGKPRPPRPLSEATLSYHFYLPDRRRRDLDNLIARCKPWVDILVKQGYVVDDTALTGTGTGIPFLNVAAEYRKNQPGVMLTLEGEME